MSLIHGHNGDKKGDKIIKSLFGTIIDSQIHSKFTWTGKSSHQQTKIAFCDYKDVIGLIHAVVRLYDGTYSKMNCEKDLTYKVLKRAVNQPSKQSTTTSDPKSCTTTLPTNSSDSSDDEIINLLLPILKRNYSPK